MTAWIDVCAVSDIVPDTGVCALLGDEQVAVFRFGDSEVYAISNFDPCGEANVLSRGIVGSIDERKVVASPLYKQHFDLRSGECLEAPEKSVRAYPVRLIGERIEVAAN